MGTLDSRELRIFLAVAGSGGFTAGARQLGLSQPGVSRATAALERKLGVQLIQRTTHTFCLTEAGRSLLLHGTVAIDALTAAETLLRRHSEETGLVVALKPDSDAGLLAPVLDVWADDPTLAPVTLLLRETDELPQAVRTGAADLCLAAGPCDLRGLDSEQLLVEPRVVVVHARHRLLDRERIALPDLVDEPIARWPGVPAERDRYYRGADGGAGGGLGVNGPAVQDLPEALRLVELGLAVTFLPVSVSTRFDRPGLATRPVVGLSESTLTLAWRAGSHDSSVAAFLEAAQLVAARSAEAGSGGAAGRHSARGCADDPQPVALEEVACGVPRSVGG